MKTEVDPQELEIFEQKVRDYIGAMEYLIHDTEKHIDDMAKTSRDAAIAGVATDIKDTCRKITVELEGMKTGPVKELGAKVKKFTNIPEEFKGRSR